MFFRQVVVKPWQRLHNWTPLPRRTCNFLQNPEKLKSSIQHDFGDHKWWRNHREAFQWLFLSGQAVIILGMNSMPTMADDISVQSSSVNNTSVADLSGLHKVEDGSVISNEHTSKWRIFTDNGRDFFKQGKLEQAEKFFLSALQEAREGFGERDPHVASACNNLAELYRVKRAFDKAEPLYMKSINILEENFGTDDIRVGAAFHNLGQFFLVQRDFERAHGCYEHALKIKRRVLGEAHIDYADTMYHLGTVLHLQGKEKDSQDLISNSIRILEESGQGESIICIRRLQYLAQMHTKSGQFPEAEILSRKILHRLELSKGWKSPGTVIAAEQLALTLQPLGRLGEAEELLERCLDARKYLLPADHIQNAANMLYIARVKILICEKLVKTNSSRAIAELEMAKNLLERSIRVARQFLVRFVEQKGKKESIGVSQITGKDGHSAMLILLQSLNALGSLEIRKVQLQDSGEYVADAVLLQCMSTFKEFGAHKSLFDTPEVKAEYLSCLKFLFDSMSKSNVIKVGTMEEVKDVIQCIEDKLSTVAE